MENGSTLGVCCDSICNYHQFRGELLDRVGGGRVENGSTLRICCASICNYHQLRGELLDRVGGGGWRMDQPSEYAVPVYATITSSGVSCWIG